MTGALVAHACASAGIATVLLERSLVGRGSTAASSALLLEEPDLEAIRDVLAEFERDGVRFHALRTRQAGSRRFISVHVLVPGAWTVQRGHDLVEHVEGSLCSRLPGASVFTHLEPAEDPRSFADTTLDRPR